MRNIVCSEDRECKLEPMAQTGGGAGGLLASENDYLIPLSTTSSGAKAAGKVKRVKRSLINGPRFRRRQTGKGKKVLGKVQQGKGRVHKKVQKGRGKGKGRVSRPKAVKQNGRKKRSPKKSTKKQQPWIL